MRVSFDSMTEKNESNVAADYCNSNKIGLCLNFRSSAYMIDK